MICSDIGQKYFEDRMVQLSPLIHFIAKPSGIFEFEVTASQVFEEYPGGGAEPTAELPCRVLWLGQGKTFENVRLHDIPELRIQRVQDLHAVPKVLEEDDCRMVVVRIRSASRLYAPMNRSAKRTLW